MQHDNHPRDERLAALAGGDPEVADDQALRAHVSSCDRCTALVDELATLRAALAELPDLAPSRRLQLVPPVPEPTPAGGGPLRWLRTLAAPAMLAGAGLALVGGIGLGGTVLGGAASGAYPEMLSADGDDRAAVQDPDSAPDATPASEGLGPPAEDERAGADGFSRFTDPSTPAPWLVLVGAGVALLVTGLVFRFAICPRAG